MSQPLYQPCVHTELKTDITVRLLNNNRLDVLHLFDPNPHFSKKNLRALSLMQAQAHTENFCPFPSFITIITNHQSSILVSLKLQWLQELFTWVIVLPTALQLREFQHCEIERLQQTIARNGDCIRNGAYKVGLNVQEISEVGCMGLEFQL